MLWTRGDSECGNCRAARGPRLAGSFGTFIRIHWFGAGEYMQHRTGIRRGLSQSGLPDAR